MHIMQFAAVLVINFTHHAMLRKRTCTLRKPGQSADQPVRPLEQMPRQMLRLPCAFRARTRLSDISSVLLAPVSLPRKVYH